MFTEVSFNSTPEEHEVESCTKEVVNICHPGLQATRGTSGHSLFLFLQQLLLNRIVTETAHQSVRPWIVPVRFSVTDLELAI